MRMMSMMCGNMGNHSLADWKVRIRFTSEWGTVWIATQCMTSSIDNQRTTDDSSPNTLKTTYMPPTSLATALVPFVS